MHLKQINNIQGTLKKYFLVFTTIKTKINQQKLDTFFKKTRQ